MHTICIVLIPDDNGQHSGDTRSLYSIAEEFGDHHGNRGDDNNLFESPIHQAGDISPKAPSIQKNLHQMRKIW